MAGNPPKEGDVRVNRLDPSRVATFTNGAWVETKGGKLPVQEASMRARMDMGLAPMVQAHQDMTTAEKAGNPLSNDWGAAVLDSVDIPIPFTSGSDGSSVRWSPLDPLAKAVGGQDYQDYTQAAKSFEAQLMPIMSGAAVSASEAQRQIRASLPELGDSPETLSKKGRARAMMLNGAAKARGLPLPYPNVPTWGVNTVARPESGGQGAPARRRYNPKTGRIE